MIQRLSILAVLFALAGCDTRTNAPSSVVTAAEGGTLMSTTHDLAIPANALPSDLEVSLETAAVSSYPALEGAREVALRLLPEGTDLELAATVTIHAETIGTVPEGHTIRVWQLVLADAADDWEARESTVDAETGDVTVSVTRFAPLAVVVSAPVVAVPETNQTIHGALVLGGVPAFNIPVTLYTQFEQLVGETTSNTSGEFWFEDVPPGEYFIVIGGDCTDYFEVTVGSGPVELGERQLCGG